MDSFYNWRENIPEISKRITIEDFNRLPERHSTDYGTWTNNLLKEDHSNQHLYVVTQGFPAFSNSLAVCNARHVSLTYHNSQYGLDIENKNIKNLDVINCPYVNLVNCYIDYLVIGAVHEKVTIKNCFIGKFMIANLIAVATHIEKGAVLSFKTDVSDKGFGDDFVLKDLYIPRDDFKNEISVQNIRNIRHRLEKSNNMLAASKLHSVESALEKKYQGRVDRIINYFYEIGADYGNSTGRPLFWFLFFWGISATIATFTDAIDVTDDPKMWEHELKGDGLKFRVYRGALYALKTVLNPLGIFSLKDAIYPKSVEYAAFSSVMGLICVISLAFFFIGLRRKFKMHAN